MVGHAPPSRSRWRAGGVGVSTSPPSVRYLRWRPDGSVEGAPSQRGPWAPWGSTPEPRPEGVSKRPLPPDVTHIRQLPDKSFEGAPSNQGPWRPIPDPRPPRRLVALPPLPERGAPPQATHGPTLWRQVFEAMAAADQRAWAQLDAISQTDGRDAAQAAGLALADRLAAEAMLSTIRLAVVDHLHNLGIHTAARMMASWFDNQITDARKGE